MKLTTILITANAILITSLSISLASATGTSLSASRSILPTISTLTSSTSSSHTYPLLQPTRIALPIVNPQEYFNRPVTYTITLGATTGIILIPGDYTDNSPPTLVQDPVGPFTYTFPTTIPSVTTITYSPRVSTTSTADTVGSGGYYVETTPVTTATVTMETGRVVVSTGWSTITTKSTSSGIAKASGTSGFGDSGAGPGTTGQIASGGSRAGLDVFVLSLLSGITLLFIGW
ncbi:hypothetical protein ABW20_dc0109517 [Dactylellina cionopaga]|nr:hypothetical protein ABW20_dc0109517 [Dactylellina cionopaga]